MRPFGLLLGTCLLVVLFYDCLGGRFPAAVLVAASAPTSAAQSSSHHETRSETLQRCLAASQLLEIDLSRYRDLRAAEVADMDDVVRSTFRKSLNKVLQGTWDRFSDEQAFNRFTASENDKEVTREFHDRDMLKRRLKLFREALCDPRTEAAKTLRKEFEGQYSEKQARVYEERILMFDRDREAALAALK